SCSAAMPILDIGSEFRVFGVRCWDGCRNTWVRPNTQYLTPKTSSGCLVSAGHCDYARARHLLDAVPAHQAVDLVDLVNAARNLNDERALAHVDDSAAKYLDDLHDLAAILRVRVDLD